MIPLCDLQQQYLAHKQELDDAMQQVAADARYILGPNVSDFEHEMADYLGCQHAVGVGNGTDALQLALRALEIGPGDEVITTPFTFIATTEAIGMVGARPVFVDIDPHTYNIDPAQLEAAITDRTKAILPVHIYGQPCDMQPIVEIAEHYGLDIIEDCAQAVGAEYEGRKAGTLGRVGCFSFFPSKNLGCFGDGGMVVTDDPQVFERVEMLRRHGGKVKYHHTELGLNSRLDELQAAILRVKLKYLDAWNNQRRAAAYRYNQLLSGFADVQLPHEFSSEGAFIPQASDASRSLSAVYHQYTIQVEQRDVFVQALLERGIQTCVYYPIPLHLQEVHAELGYRRGDFPVAEHVAERCLSLPMFPEIETHQQQEVTAAIWDAVGARQQNAA